MSLLRPLLVLVVVLVLGFIFSKSDPNFLASLKQVSFNAATTIQNSSSELVQNVNQSVQSTVEDLKDNLPPPLFGSTTTSAGTAGTLSASGIITITNEERAENGNLAALSENTKLDEEAEAKVKDMFAKQYFEHVSPSGVGPSNLATEFGYQYSTIGENLALGNFGSNQSLLDAWMNSPGHRANILNSRFTEIGAATEEGIYDGEETWLSVQEFGRPLSACPSPDATLETKIENLKNDLASKDATMETEKNQIDNADPKSGPTYDSEINDYNDMVNAYNTEVVEEKADITTYNQEVNTFNNCTGSS